MNRRNISEQTFQKRPLPLLTGKISELLEAPLKELMLFLFHSITHEVALDVEF